MNVISMSDAKAQGLKRYFTGASCPHGHVSERLVSTRACYECARGRKHLWNADNQDKVNAQKRAYAEANPEKVKAWKDADQKKHRDKANERSLRWYHANRDQAKAATARWQKENPAQSTAKSVAYYAARMRQLPAWADLGAIESVYLKAAAMREAGLDVHVDHVIPLRGRYVRGLHVHDNLQIINAYENRSKSNNF